MLVCLSTCVCVCVCVCAYLYEGRFVLVVYLYACMLVWLEFMFVWLHVYLLGC